MQSTIFNRNRTGRSAIRGRGRQPLTPGLDDHNGTPLSPNSTSQAAHKAHAAAVALFGVCMAALLIAAVCIVADLPRQVATPAGLLLVSTLLPAAFAYAVGDLDLMEPVQLISAIIAANFGLRALYIVWPGDSTTPWLLGRGEYLDNVPAALWLALIGYWCLLLATTPY